MHFLFLVLSLGVRKEFYLRSEMKSSALISLIKKDLLLEWRQKHTYYGALLYVGSTVFVLYLLNGEPDSQVWNALFWIAQLFVSVNAVAKSFLQEPASRFRYYYTMVKPSTFILAKSVYSILILCSLSLLSLLLFFLFLGNPLERPGAFVALLLLGSLSLSLVFTFLSAIAARTQQNAAIMAILGFPLVMPLLLLLSNLSLSALAPVQQPGWYSGLAFLLAMDLMVALLGILLFPYLWQE